MSSCKLNINSLPINVIVVFLLVFCALHLVPLIPWARREVRGQGASSFAKATADRKVKGPEFESIRG
jgi:hypothetical protein